jgi:hypothetical protein
MMRLVFLAVMMAFVSCATSPPDLREAWRGSCNGDPRIVGVWKETRLSQLGENRVTIVLRCDCTFSRTENLVQIGHTARLKGTYSARGGVLTLSMEGGSEESQYAVEGDSLRIDAGPAEQYQLRRVRAGRCRSGNPSA